MSFTFLTTYTIFLKKELESTQPHSESGYIQPNKCNKNHPNPLPTS